jgi:hypothetical protein
VLNPPAATAVSTMLALACVDPGVVAGDDAAGVLVEGAVVVEVEGVVAELHAPTSRARLTAPAAVIERFIMYAFR